MRESIGNLEREVFRAVDAQVRRRIAAIFRQRFGAEHFDIRVAALEECDDVIGLVL